MKIARDCLKSTSKISTYVNVCTVYTMGFCDTMSSLSQSHEEYCHKEKFRMSFDANLADVIKIFVIGLDIILTFCLYISIWMVYAVWELCTVRSLDHMDCLFCVKRVWLIMVGCFKENRICMS